MRRIMLVVAVAALFLLALAGPALAAPEQCTSMPSGTTCTKSNASSSGNLNFKRTFESVTGDELKTHEHFKPST
jgi:hypothetical protein